MTTTIYNFIHQLMEMIKEGFKSFTIYKGQSRYYLSIGKYSIPPINRHSMKTVILNSSSVSSGIEYLPMLK